MSWHKLEENPLPHADELDLGYVPGWGEEEEPNLYLLLHFKWQALGVFHLKRFLL